MKKLKRYEIRAAVIETWCYEVIAESEEQAMSLYLEGDADQIYSLSGGNPKKGAFVYRTSPIVAAKSTKNKKGK